MLNLHTHAAAPKPPLIASEGENIIRSNPAVILTDEDARAQMPQIAIVRDEYFRYRAAGDDPPTAYKKTMASWRELRAGLAYIPHRGT